MCPVSSSSQTAPTLNEGPVTSAGLGMCCAILHLEGPSPLPSWRGPSSVKSLFQIPSHVSQVLPHFYPILSQNLSFCLSSVPLHKPSSHAQAHCPVRMALALSSSWDLPSTHLDQVHLCISNTKRPSKGRHGLSPCLSTWNWAGSHTDKHAVQ